MKYNLYINQIMAVKLGMNVNQALVFDLLTRSPIWATPIEIDNSYYWWVSRQKICRELELLSMKPDTAYRHLKALADLKLIDYKKQGLKDCIAITELGKSYVGNKSEETRKQIRKESEINPIYPTSNDNTTSIISIHRFDEFWNVWPQGYKSNKKGCLAKWQSNNLDVIADKIIADVISRSKESKKWNTGYIPAPLTYINQERWNDDLDKVIVQQDTESFEYMNMVALGVIEEKKSEVA